MRRLLILALVAFTAALAAPSVEQEEAGSRSSWGKVVTVSSASAHRAVDSWTAEQRVYNKYNHLCGTVAWGWTWCHRRQTALHSGTLGDHSWQVRYTWMEAKIGTTYGCGILVQYYTHTGSYTVLSGPSCAV